MWEFACFCCKCPVFFIWQCVFALCFFIYTVHLCIYGHVWSLICASLVYKRSDLIEKMCSVRLKRITCSGWFLLNFPDGYFAVGPRGSAEHVAIFSRAQSLNAVVVCHQLLLHRVSILVQHVDLAAGFPIGAASAAAHPDLRPGEIVTSIFIFHSHIWTDKCEWCLTWFLTLIMQTTPAQSLSWILMKGLFRSLQCHTHSSPASAKPAHSSCDCKHIPITSQLTLRFRILSTSITL